MSDNLSASDRQILKQIATTNKYRSTPRYRPSLERLERLGHIEQYIIRYGHIRYYRLTERGKGEISNG